MQLHLHIPFASLRKSDQGGIEISGSGLMPHIDVLEKIRPRWD